MSSVHEEQTDYLDQGYIFLPKIYGEDEVQELTAKINIEAAERKPPFRTNKEGEVARLCALADRADIFLKAIRNSGLTGHLLNILGPNIVYIRNRHNHATFNRTGESDTRLHRDILQTTRGLLTAIVYLEESSAETGATVVVPRSQRAPFVGVSQKYGGGTWMEEHQEYKELIEDKVIVEAEPGDVMLFDSLLFHAPTENITNRSRISLALGYRAVDELAVVKDTINEIPILGESNFYRGNNEGLNYIQS